MALQAGTHLGPYEILAPLGAGGMGEVYRARDPRLGRDVAIKVLPDGFAQDPDRLRRFEREARSAGGLNHPNVLAIYDVGRAEPGFPYLVSELLEGQTLRERLREGGFPVQKTLDYAQQIAHGLAAAHDRGVVHRDLKPENLFLTRDGRVKILDFGLATAARSPSDGPAGGDALTASAPGSAAGTASYMSPEQVRGLRVDERSDVFSFGCVLYELVSGRRPFTGESSVETMTAILREDPPRLSGAGRRSLSSGVERLILRCLEKRPEDRFQSSRDLALALEALSAESAPSLSESRPERKRAPYPGLAPFTEADAGRFFGREAEVEALRRRLDQKHLLALVGPSGAGKTSFLRAGLVPALPRGWRALVCQPGDGPSPSLAQALVPELSGDTEALKDLLRFEDPDVAVSCLGRWRRRHAEVLLVVDQFEELFTLNPPGVQESFSQLLGRLVTEAGVHVLLSLRDDFLIQCHAQAALAPVFSELTPLTAPRGAALRRALVQPAIRSGYRFEDEALVDEMLAEVGEERGALPLLAFAASRLWERRDTVEGLLTRDAYREIGGVAGALARHAEAILERIGPDRQEVVRELFRNLVTAEGTRAARDREELLSVFDDRASAEEVLSGLIEGRLLTSFELEGDEGRSRQRIEVIHESLLAAWPRLVRWRTQDADGAQLRDQVRQAARLWSERDRSPDLLWSGSAYREFQLWRERYPGGLSGTELAFADAMTRHAERVRRRRRWLASGVGLALFAVAVVTTALWRQALAEARRADAQQLLARAQLVLDDYPTAAVAWATKSLERSDTSAARRLLVEALLRGPIARVLTVLGEEEGRSTLYAFQLRFRPDGSWVAMGGNQGVQVWPRDGGEPLVFDGYPRTGGVWPCFAPDGTVLATLQDRLDLWSFPAGKLLSSREAPGFDFCVSVGEGVLAVGVGDPVRLQSWPFDGGEPGPLVLSRPGSFDLQQRFVATVDGLEVYLRPFDRPDAPPRHLGTLGAARHAERFDPDGRRLAVEDVTGEMRVWPTDPEASTPALRLSREAATGIFEIDRTGSWLAAKARGSVLRTQLWDLDGPPDAEPLELRRKTALEYFYGLAFDPSGQWLATTHNVEVAFWPLAREYPRLLRRDLPVSAAAFTPDGTRVITAGADGAVWVWPLSPAAGEAVHVLFDTGGPPLRGLDVSPSGDLYAVAGWRGGVYVGSLAGGEPRKLEGFLPTTRVGRVAFDPTGRRVAAALRMSETAAEKVIRVWDLETGETHVLGPLETARAGYAGCCGSLQFTPDGRLLESADGLRLWSLPDGSFEVLDDAVTGPAALSPDGRRVVYARRTDDVDSFFDTPAGGTASGWHSLPVVLDLDTRESRILANEGLQVALGPGGDRFATSSYAGDIFVGSLAGGGELHLLPGHERKLEALAVSPDGRRILSASGDGTLRLWPMPEGRPFHTLPRAELLERLHALTNLRVEPSETAPGGYELEIGPFPGWADVPTW